MKKASPFICGTVILTLSNFFSRLIGFYNRIFLAGVIGAHQIGIYQLIFPVYLLGFAVCFQGFQIALSKITAEKKATGNINAARYVLRITIILTLCLCIIFSFFVFWYAELICSVFLHEPSCVPCLRLAVLVLPFVGIKNCIHDRENASSCFSSCLWNDCWGDRFIFLYSDLLFLTQKVC